MQGEDPGWFWNSWTTVTPVSSGALIWKLSIVKSQIALFECSQTKLTGSIGTPEAPDQQQCLVLGPRCDTPEMRWSTPRTHVFVFGQSSKHRCALKVAWLRKNVCGFCQKSYTPENYSWSSKIFVGHNKNAVCRDQNAVGLNQNARLVTFTIAENQNDYGLWPWRSASCCFCNFVLQQNMVLYFDKIDCLEFWTL